MNNNEEKIPMVARRKCNSVKTFQQNGVPQGSASRSGKGPGGGALKKANLGDGLLLTHWVSYNHQAISSVSSWYLGVNK